MKMMSMFEAIATMIKNLLLVPMTMYVNPAIGQASSAGKSTMDAECCESKLAVFIATWTDSEVAETTYNWFNTWRPTIVHLRTLPFLFNNRP